MRSLADVEAALKDGQTQYEKDNSVERLSVTTIPCGEDFGLLTVLTSDMRIGLVAAFAARGRWFYWYPSENQLNYLARLVDFIRPIAKHNRSVSRTEQYKTMEP